MGNQVTESAPTDVTDELLRRETFKAWVECINLPAPRNVGVKVTVRCEKRNLLHSRLFTGLAEACVFAGRCRDRGFEAEIKERIPVLLTEPPAVA